MSGLGGQNDRFDPHSLDNVPWLTDLLAKPDDASWPRFMSPPHPDATGSYGTLLESWLLREQGITLRWWQRLATRRQLEHDGDGRLCWGTVVESCSRRVGKSQRLAALATWRMAYADLLGETQTIIHTGSDLGICREIQRRAWRWAEEKAQWTVYRANGKEAIETPKGDRWLTRSQSAVYGYDASLALADEAWDVPAQVIDEGLEPALIERLSPQLVLTSTAHRQASSLMPRRIASARAGMGEDFDTLLMLWGADEDDDIGDPDTWRKASAHWSEHRLKLITAKYERAMRGEADPEADDVDPIEGFRAQYLNIWPAPDAPRQPPGKVVVTADEWASLNGFSPGTPNAAAVEAWFHEGAAMATAEQLEDGRIGVSVATFDDVPTAIAAAQGSGATTILVGKSIAAGVVGVEPTGGTSRQAVMAIRRLIDDQMLTHDGSEALTEQMLALRTVDGSDGPRLASKGRQDGLKACAWASAAAQRAAEAPMIWL